MPDPKIIGTGLTGLVGSRVVELLSSQFEFENLSKSGGLDITDAISVKAAVSASDAPLILHMAAKTDVDGSEDDKLLGEEGETWQTNVVGTQNIVEAARSTGKKLIYISTDFVFDGAKDFYVEEDTTNAVNWYGHTKEEGEVVVQKGNIEYIIARIAYPYCAYNSRKLDFVHKIIERLKGGKKIFAVTDQIITPTYIDDIAAALSFLFTKNISGIFHLVGSSSLTPAEIISDIVSLYGFDKGLIVETTRNEFFKGRAFRPFKLALKNDKIAKFGIKMRTFTQGLEEFKKLQTIK